MTARVVVCAQQKGGDGKTTTAVNMAVCLAMKGMRVLLVDSDPQANATSSCLEITDGGFLETTYSVYGEPMNATKRVLEEYVKGFHLMPANGDLAAVDWEFNFNTDDKNANLLKKTLEGVKEDFDFIIVDVPPTLGTLTINGLVAATDVVIPLHPEPYGVDGIQQLLETIVLVRKINPQLRVNGVLLTKVMPNSLHRDIEQETREFFGQIGIPVFQTKIPYTPFFGKAAKKHVPASLLYKNNLRVRSYMRFVEEAFDV